MTVLGPDRSGGVGGGPDAGGPCDDAEFVVPLALPRDGHPAIARSPHPLEPPPILRQPVVEGLTYGAAVPSSATDAAHPAPADALRSALAADTLSAPAADTASGPVHGAGPVDPTDVAAGTGMPRPAAEAAAGAASVARHPRALRKPFSLDVLEWIGLIAGALLVALVVKAMLFQAFVIPSRSMEPTLRIGNRVLVFKLSSRLGNYERGDVVVFARPDALRGTDDDSDLIKRVIGLPGDVVDGRKGRVYVNGRLLAEPWFEVVPLTSDFGPMTVPDGTLWVMGDNRGNSQDSRVFGFLDQSAVRGEAFLRWWPISRFAGL